MGLGAPGPAGDPLTRRLRALAAATFLVLIVLVVSDPFHRGTDYSVLVMLIGGLALWLGYEVVLPFMRGNGNDGDDHD